MALARTRLRITNMMFPLMGRFAHSERVYPLPEHQSNHVTALSAREDGGDASPMFLFAGAEVPVSGRIADRFTDGGENLLKERLETLRRVRKEWAGDDFCLSGGSAGGIPDNRVPRLLVELLAHVLVAVGGIVAYAPVELKRLV
jgi:hypothetical protein